jgi:anti-sigma-K factor RskA
MTADQDHGEESGGDSVLVGEYILGLLGPAEHAALGRRIAAEPALAAELRLWQSRLSTLDNEFAETEPPPRTWNGIEARLFPAAGRSSGDTINWFHSIALWRGFAAFATAVAILAIGFNLVQPRPGPAPAPAQLVAALQPQEGSGVEFVAFYDTQSGAVRLVGLSGQQIPDKDYELWYIRGDEPAVSMGVVPVDQRTEIPLDQAAREKIAAGTVLAVTLEQKGGSPTGVAQGPIVAVGKATPI